VKVVAYEQTARCLPVAGAAAKEGRQAPKPITLLFTMVYDENVSI
jgi:hypothetical protein